MKRFVGFASMVVLLAAPAFGAGTKSEKVDIPQAVQIGSTQVPAGNYKLEYSGTGNVQVTLTKNGKTVTTFAAKAVDQKNPNPGVNLLHNGGVVDLEAIYLSNATLDLTGAPQAGQ